MHILLYYVRRRRVRDRTWLSSAKNARANNLRGLEIVCCVFFIFEFARVSIIIIKCVGRCVLHRVYRWISARAYTPILRTVYYLQNRLHKSHDRIFPECRRMRVTYVFLFKKKKQYHDFPMIYYNYNSHKFIDVPEYLISYLCRLKIFLKYLCVVGTFLVYFVIRHEP